MRQTIGIAALFALAACGMNGTDGDDGAQDSAATTPAAPSNNLADSMASHDGTNQSSQDVPDIPDAEQRPMMQAQVVLDRQGFGPGVVDGKMGLSTENALNAFQRANKLDETGKLDQPTRQALSQWQSIPATRVVRIPANWGDTTYQPIPDKPSAQAEMQRLGYTSLDERLAERFHTTVDTLKALNPGGQPAGSKGAAAGPSVSPSATASPSPTPTATSSTSTDAAEKTSSVFRAGQLVRVPNIGADRIAPGAIEDADWQRTLTSLGVGSEQPHLARIVVSKSKDTLLGYDDDGNLRVAFTVTSGSSHDPLPLGDWKINGISHNPKFSFDPSLFWDVPDDEAEHRLPPGPNGPVGVVWIDLSKEHYGIHGTSEPETIGRAQSHGCVRLTNWDAARLSEMVDQKTKVEFVA
ncbi:L,D-transpeptidase family protein [Erythrobacter sp. LQ02-29]|uniref:L,D-transpeptidase family protein n=1 Tax=Erythrobacter sp. LQ02-29 TaxID=2920384 RepID=UPI001F4D7311|nr:L,D-transpeptidase family protein [Erythrobacter sp. LQ02-29]MCP9223399.1 L,D-transpeptidase family protein [Erythrobacter sp. LQ02-29]